MRILKQSSTVQPLLFLLVSSADHITGLIGATATVALSKAGAAFAAPAGAVSEIGNGWYKIAGNATDTGTLGPLALHATATGADPIDIEYAVVAFDPQSATNLGLSSLPAASPATNGGLATVDGSNNVHGLQTRTVSDSSVIGTSTFATGGNINVTQWAGVTVTGMPMPTYTQPTNFLTTTFGGTMATVANQTSILAAVNGITSNTARSAPRVPDFMPRVASGSVAYTGDLYLYNLQGQLEDADSSAVTVHARNAAGTSLDANLGSTGMTRISAGVYRLTYNVAANATVQAVYFDFSWAINAAAMKDGAATEVQDAENYAALVAIQAKTDLIGTTSADSTPTQAANAKIASIVVSGFGEVNVSLIGGSSPIQTNGKFWVVSDNGNPLLEANNYTAPDNADITIIKTQAVKIGTNAADSPATVTMQGRVDTNVASRGTYSGGNITGNLSGNVVGSVGSLIGYLLPLTGQQTRDALALALTNGNTPATGSIDNQLATISAGGGNNDSALLLQIIKLIQSR